MLLYELLIGKTPFDSKELLHSGINEMRRIIREQEPQRPSTRLSTMLDKERTTTAQRRAVSTPDLIHLLKGDLDWIVMKCLEKDRTRRYETASGLASDIQNYLGNEPVTARPPTTGYRLGKLVRRNKLAFVASAAVAMALVIGILVSAWQATRARRAEQSAKAEKESAEAVLKFFRDKVLSAGRPEGMDGGLGRDVTLRKAIDSAESQIAEAFKDRPLVEAALRHSIGFSYLSLGESPLAVQQLERALALYRQQLGLDHPDTLWIMHHLASAHAAVGKDDLALQLDQQAFELRKATLGREHPDTLSSMHYLGLSYLDNGRLDQALPLFEEGFKVSKAKLGLNHPSTIYPMRGIAKALSEQGKHNAVEEFLGQALREFRELGSTNAAAVLQLRGEIHGRRGHFKEAAVDFAEALRMQPTDRNLYNFLTTCLVPTGDLEAYRRNCQQLMAHFADTTDPGVADRIAKDCSVLPASGVDLVALDRISDRALAAGEAHWAFPWFLLSKGMVQYRQGRYASAAETMQKVLDKNGDGTHRGVQAWMVLAMARHQLGEMDQARSALAQGLELAETRLPKLESGDLGRGLDWVDWPFAHAFMREARSLIEKNAQ